MKRAVSVLLVLAIVLMSATVSFAASVFTVEKDQSNIIINVDLKGRDSVSIIVKAPGREKFSYVVKNSTETTFTYKPKSEGEYTFRAIFKTGNKTAKTKYKTVTVGETAAEKEKFVPSVYVRPAPTIIENAGDAMDAINLTVVTYGDSLEIKARNIKAFFSGIRSAGSLHNGFLVGGSVEYGAKTKGSDQTFYFTLDYDEAGQLVREKLFGIKADDTGDVDFLRKYVDSTLSKILKDGMTEKEIAQAIHDHIVKTYHYDMDGYYGSGSFADSYTALGLVRNGYSVCEGYAELFCLLSVYADMHCFIVTGEMQGVGHMWNKIRIDGKWYNVDCTSDDPIPDEPGRVMYDYFMKPDTYLNKNGFVWQDDLWPAAK